MVASIGAIAAPSQGVSYYERDGYYAKDDPDHRAASAWAGKGADALGLSGPVDPDTFTAILKGRVPDGPRLGRPGKDGEIVHRPGRDLTLSAPKSVSLAALVGGDARVAEAHGRAVERTLAWVEERAVETRMKHPDGGRMIRAGDQKAVIATFTHETSRNLDPQLHTHAVIANMVQGDDGKWRTMANEKLYSSKMLIGALYRGELARELGKLGYGIEKTNADGRFEIAGVSREVIDAFSTRRAEIEAAMDGRGLGTPAENQRAAQRAALMTRAAKRDVDRTELREMWQRQADGLGFDTRALTVDAMDKIRDVPSKDRGVGRAAASDGAAARQADLFDPLPQSPADAAMAWAVAHLSEREAVFAKTDLLAAALAWKPGSVTIGEVEAAAARLEKDGTLHSCGLPQWGESLTTDKAVADEKETIALMERGQGVARPVMKDLAAKTHRGLRGRVEAGKSGGGLCYGYDVVKSLDGSGDPVRGGRTVNETEAEIVRRVFREFADGASPRAIARRLNGEGVPGPSGKLWMDTTIRGHAKRGTGLINNELYIGRLVWNRLRYVKNPETGKRVSRINPPEEWIVAEVPELRIVDDELWQAVKHRQGEITVQYATVIEATQSARANRLNGAHRPRHLLSGLLECGVCGGPYSMRGQDRYGCSNHIMTGTCTNGRGIRRAVIEERVLSGLKDRLMAPEAAAEAMRAWAEETNRINRERRASGASDRKELAQVEKKIAAMIAVIEDGGYVRGMVDRLRELEARQDELNERLSAAPADLPDIHPNIADVYRRKVARLAEALDHPEDRDAAASAIRGLIERIVLTPSEKWAEMDAVLHGDLGTILEWAGNGRGNTKTDIPMREMSVSVVAGAGFEPAIFGSSEDSQTPLRASLPT